MHGVSLKMVAVSFYPFITLCCMLAHHLRIYRRVWERGKGLAHFHACLMLSIRLERTRIYFKFWPGCFACCAALENMM